jgi:hypothetical protein
MWIPNVQLFMVHHQAYQASFAEQTDEDERKEEDG